MPSGPAADESDHRTDLMKAGTEKTRRSFWETPRTLAVLVGAVAAAAGLLGYKFGQMPQPAPIVVNLPAQGGGM